MQVHIRGYCDRAAASKGKAGEPISFVASTSGLARDGLIIDAGAWQLDNYQRSPVVLWSHDYMGNHPPIGRAENVRVEDGKLLADVTFDSADPFAAEIERKYRQGFINAVSVGWDTMEMAVSQSSDTPPRVTKAELLDISAVNVPGDPNALMERQKRAYADLGKALLEAADAELPAKATPVTTPPDPDPAPSARATWAETATAMVRLFEPFAQRPDAERDAEYKRLQREYARHGKTPPELLPTATVDALTVDAVRAHFLEGEAELLPDVFTRMGSRAGAVLSKRNRDDLAQAVSLIQGVVERAQKEADTTDEERAAEDALLRLARTFKLDKDAA